MVQLELSLQPVTPQVFNLVDQVRRCLYGREWVTPSEIQRAIYNKTNEWHSDSSITARIRDSRKPSYGSHAIEKRRREGSRSYEYRIQT